MSASGIVVQVIGTDAGLQAVVVRDLRLAGFRVTESAAPRRQAAVAVVVLAGGGPDAQRVVREIMSTAPLPVVLVARHSDRERTAPVVQAGALDVVLYPDQWSKPGETSPQLARAVRLVAGMELVRRVHRPRSPQRADETAVPAEALVAIGASTGGPQTIATVLRAMPARLGAPIVIVQHIAPGFVTSLATWLSQDSGRRVSLATAGAPAVPDVIHLAPGDVHLVLRPDGRFETHAGPPVHACRPSADVFFTSVALARGPHAVGVLLTGMGEDGAAGLLAMRAAGGVTIAQDEATSVVYGMPRAAAARGAATYVLPLPRIGPVVADAIARAGRLPR